MKMTVFVVNLLLLLTAVTAAASMAIIKSSAEVYPLDMAEKSVDDSFKGCRDAMEKLVLSKYIEREKMNTPGFKNAWEKALNKCSKETKFRNQCAAIYLYTGNPEKNPNCSYIEFNAATRNGKAAYKSNQFKYYTLFFYLTDAVQKLKGKKSGCVTTYRRTGVTFQTDVLNKTIRFGSFTSTSLELPPTRFGNKSCFEVETCYGAEVTKYSKFKHEREVLIPPYEIFRVTSVKKNTLCEVVYKLKSDKKKKSDLKCAKVRP